MPALRPALTAFWRNLVMLNFSLPTNSVEPLCPVGTEPDLHNGQAYISMVGFRFEQTRLFGLPIPAHTNFDEINLRFYVRRIVGEEVRRGVVFIREIVPRRALALVANFLYNENYVTRPMRNQVVMAGSELAAGDRIEYQWLSKSPRPCREPSGEGAARTVSISASPLSWFRRRSGRWNRLAARVAAPLELPAPGSLEEFIVEHYWGYVRGRDGATREYRVAHVPWRVARADAVVWDCDLSATYNTPLAAFMNVEPVSAIVAVGSPIQVFRGQRLRS
jgi:uncharacterized protein YqjF (DUF2071 family)